MITKVIAAKRAARSGAHTVIASGREARCHACAWRVASRLGTLLVSEMQPLTARKQWFADHLQLNGKLVLDAGASPGAWGGQEPAAYRGGRCVQGEFERGAAVACVSPLMVLKMARGLANYGSSDARRIARRASAGYRGASSVTWMSPR
jgi:glutamate 5-kinase